VKKLACSDGTGRGGSHELASCKWFIIAFHNTGVVNEIKFMAIWENSQTGGCGSVPLKML
jgi:hypothetical protein